MTPPAAPEQLTYLTISDFTPGIMEPSFASTGSVPGSQSPGPPGAATSANTYRCYALPHGGLGPLPKRYYNYSRAAIGNSATRYITGFHVFGPVHAFSSAGWDPGDETSLSTHDVDFFLGYGYENAGHHFEKLDLLRVWDGTTILNLYSLDENTELTGYYGGWTFGTWRYGNNIPPPTVGYPSVAFSWRQPSTTLFNRKTALFPDPAGVTPYVLDGMTGSGYLITHQGRLVVSVTFGGDPWGGARTYEEETVIFSDPYDNDSAAGEFIQIGPEQSYGIGAMCSLSASDLLVIKDKGGAYLVQGDLSYPIVRHLPGVTSTGGTQCTGIASAIGYVYGVNHGGVRVWNGSPNSAPLAPQLNDDFWIASDTTHIRKYRGKFAQWKDFILAPNNWVFDQRTKGWWRLEDTSVYTYHCYDTSPFNNVLYAARTQFSDASPVCVSGWDPTLQATSYSWQSLPIGPTAHRTFDVRELQIVAQGSGTIAWTLSGNASIHADDSGTITLPAEAAAKPQLLRTNCSWNGNQVSIRVQPDGGSTDAPIIYSIKLGYRERAGVAKQ